MNISRYTKYRVFTNECYVTPRYRNYKFKTEPHAMCLNNIGCNYILYSFKTVKYIHAIATEATNNYRHCSTCRKISKMDSAISFVRYKICGKKVCLFRYEERGRCLTLKLSLLVHVFYSARHT